MSRKIDFYFSMPSPWAYIGWRPFKDLVRTHSLEVNYKPVSLGELFSESGGLPLNKRHPVRQRYRMLELQRWREKRGLQFNLQPQHWPFPARLADGMIVAAIEGGHDVSRLLDVAFPAIWERDVDFSDAAALAGIADEAGLPGEQLVNASRTAEIEAVYETNRLDALKNDVFGSPAYVLDGEVFWGQDRLDLLGDALASNRAPFKP